ncbi:hypothetical protein D9M71_285920 [compost metagenome]
MFTVLGFVPVAVVAAGLRLAQPVITSATLRKGKAKYLIDFMIISINGIKSYFGAHAGSRTSPCSLGKFIRKRPSVDIIDNKPRLPSRVA